MTNITAMQQELRDITQRLSEAHEQVNAGVSLDLSDLGPRAQMLCEQILRLPPEHALSMLEEMTDAIEKLNALSEQLKTP